MKTLFLNILLVLVAASFYTIYSSAERESDIPMITWRTDANPQREDQVKLFEQWLIKNGHVTPDGRAKVRVRVETANNQSTLIQAVSGMAGDIFDTGDLIGYQQLGVCTDVTEEAKARGFGLDTTYTGMARLLTDDNGRQYGYPCNGATVSMWINLDTLKRFGFDKRPPLEWTPEEFEKMGVEYVKRANEGKARQEYFFTQSLDSGWGCAMIMSIVRSRGLDLYNETLTRCIGNHEYFRDAFALFHKWTYKDHIAPTAADVAAMNTDAGYGGGDYSNFLSGKYAMIVMGRYCLIRFREDEEKTGRDINFAVSQLPMYEFKNLPISSRSAVLYKGSKYKELGLLFLEFLASREYNQYIIDMADGLPPNLDVVRDSIPEIEKQRPNERDTSALEFQWAETIAIPGNWSPYVKTGTTNWLQNSLNRYFNDRATLEEAVAFLEDRYNFEIENSKEANPKVMKQWEEDWAIQQKIDEYKKLGKKIPVQWIKNPFYVKYYRAKGMLDEGAAPGGDK